MVDQCQSKTRLSEIYDATKKDSLPMVPLCPGCWDKLSTILNKEIEQHGRLNGALELGGPTISVFSWHCLYQLGLLCGVTKPQIPFL